MVITTHPKVLAKNKVSFKTSKFSNLTEKFKFPFNSTVLILQNNINENVYSLQSIKKKIFQSNLVLS